MRAGAPNGSHYVVANSKASHTRADFGDLAQGFVPDNQVVTSGWSLSIHPCLDFHIGPAHADPKDLGQYVLWANLGAGDLCDCYGIAYSWCDRDGFHIVTAPLARAAKGSVQIECSADKRQVGKGLREVPQPLATVTSFLCVQTQVVCVT